MRKYTVRFISTIIAIWVCLPAYAQLLTWSPSFPASNDPIEITMDATKGNQGLLGYTGNVYVHLGLITSASKNASDWKYVPFIWGGSAAFSQAVSLGNNKWKYSINNIRTFFNVPSNEAILKIVILFRQGGCSNCAAQRNTDGSDMYVSISEASQQLRFEKPEYLPLYNPVPEPIQLTTNQSLDVKAIAKDRGTITLSLNGTVIIKKDDSTAISNTFIFTNPGNYTITGYTINSKGESASESFSFIVNGSVSHGVTLPIPTGSRPGINRFPGDTSLILALVAPNKSSVSVIGDFPGNDWTEIPSYRMNLDPDLKTWWIKINGLKPNTEYSYQYVVDSTLKIADPYAEKILDPSNDVFISQTTYPNLKAYPVGKTNGIVGIVSPNNNDYSWKSKFTRPDQTRLVIYELLLRDFESHHDFNALIDTLHYLSSLGINAVELMPINEFEGNQSWGYNPSFYFAVDKYYGSAVSFKRFVDSCHGRGIAVILDMVLNHATGTCPLAALYWDGVNQRPTADNPWFNVTARHPFNVFNDFNHESLETKYFSSRVMEYWLKEYKIDGYRFDLSKGFTQKSNPNDVSAWSAYDASRIAIWKQYYDSIQQYSQGAYTILEHFADNAEESVLSAAGMLLWGNGNYNYNEATMGYTGTSNFEWSIPQARGWTKPNLVSYMESHDEERLMYRNETVGNSSGSYTTKNIATALDRMKLAASFFLLSPGAKMIWQFGELGYDYSINTCINGTVNNNCRLDSKPMVWQYLQDPARKALLEWYKKLIKLRTTKAFESTNNQASYRLGTALKYLILTGSDVNVVVVGNFDVVPVTASVGFPKTGTWIDLKDNTTLNVTQNVSDLTLKAGEYHVYLDRALDQITPTKEIHSPDDLEVYLYPNPSMKSSTLQFNLSQSSEISVMITDLQGRVIQQNHDRYSTGIHTLNLKSILRAGTYFIKIKTNKGSKTIKYIQL